MFPANGNATGSGALRLIAVAGVFLFVLMFVFAFGLRQIATRDSDQRVTAAASGNFNGARAYESLKKIVAVGPRPPGSREAEQTRTIIRTELEAAGLEVMALPFEAETPYGKKTMVNMVGVVKGDTHGIIALSNHYDTKYLPEIRFVGANDGGSTTAWMLEMARALGPSRKGRTIWLIWFDGEEAFKEWTDSDSLYGSREFVRYLRREKLLDSLHTLINVDMIGDCYLGVFRDAGAPSWLQNAIWKKAAELGYDKHFTARSTVIQDDHTPFRFAGVQCINLIDYEYGGSPLEHSNTWHTENDNIDRVCPDSLQAVGDVIYHALPVIESSLDAQARRE
ncbi:MAG TPA: M28 family peptidase [Candidatus Hydrogenedentes bacterium]|nr:M28 family peptidase [Candidatus Hydrogenedentota bacterium]